MTTELNRTHTTPTTTNWSIGLRNRNATLGKSELIAGLEAGLGAGYVMGMVAMVVSWIHDWGLWVPFNDIAGIFNIQLAAAGTAFSLSALIVSILIHFGLSLAFGVGFAALYSGLLKLNYIPGLPTSIGLASGLVTWLLARFVALPILGSELYAAPAFLIAHLVFGATLGLLYPLLVSRYHRRHQRRHQHAAPAH